MKRLPYQNAGDGYSYIIIFYEYTGEKGKYIQQKLKQKYEQDEKFFNEK